MSENTVVTRCWPWVYDVRPDEKCWDDSGRIEVVPTYDGKEVVKRIVVKGVKKGRRVYAENQIWRDTEIKANGILLEVKIGSQLFLSAKCKLRNEASTFFGGNFTIEWPDGAILEFQEKDGHH